MISGGKPQGILRFLGTDMNLDGELRVSADIGGALEMIFLSIPQPLRR